MKIAVDSEIELTQIANSDARDIFETIDAQRVYLGKWLPFVEHTTALRVTEQYVDSVVNAPREQFEFVFVVRKCGKFAGLVGMKDTDKQNRKTEIGYWLSETEQKHGIITKSVQRLCQFIFEELNLNRIQIKCAVDNMPSRRVPQRLGFKLEGVERQGELLSGNRYTDLEIYSKLKSENQIQTYDN